MSNIPWSESKNEAEQEKAAWHSWLGRASRPWRTRRHRPARSRPSWALLLHTTRRCSFARLAWPCRTSPCRGPWACWSRTPSPCPIASNARFLRHCRLLFDHRKSPTFLSSSSCCLAMFCCCCLDLDFSIFDFCFYIKYIINNCLLLMFINKIYICLFIKFFETDFPLFYYSFFYFLFRRTLNMLFIKKKRRYFRFLFICNIFSYFLL